eukprot:1065396-Pelagomonas_calceolata.AAC.2
MGWRGGGQQPLKGVLATLAALNRASFHQHQMGGQQTLCSQSKVLIFERIGRCIMLGDSPFLKTLPPAQARRCTVHHITHLQGAVQTVHVFDTLVVLRGQSAVAVQRVHDELTLRVDGINDGLGIVLEPWEQIKSRGSQAR